MSSIQTTGSDSLPVADGGEGAAEKLATDQQTALELLLTGKSITETARSAGVSRTTVYHWLRHDPVFQAAYNQWHSQMQESCRSRLVALTDKATNALEKALEAGDARAALQLLKGMGMIRESKPGSANPAEVKVTMELEERKRKVVMRSEAKRVVSAEIYGKWE